MGKDTKIAWTDSTMNFWWGCQKVGPGCDHCYAEAVDKRAGGDPHWGPGVARRRTSISNWNDAYRWNRNAEQFFMMHGRRQRVFASSMSDIFDNAVPLEWAHDAFKVMEDCNRLDWQPLTKRVGMVEKRIPDRWHDNWPRHVGLMITCVNQEEADRDMQKLIDLKNTFDIPWVGVSYEPAQGPIDFREWLWDLDWIIFGGESGAGWRHCDLSWARSVRDQCKGQRTKFFMKQVADFRPVEAQIPGDLMIREFPEWER